MNGVDASAGRLLDAAFGRRVRRSMASAVHAVDWPTNDHTFIFGPALSGQVVEYLKIYSRIFW